MILGVVPARGGSMRLPGKNLRTIAGRTLVEGAVQSGQDATLIDRVVVSSEDQTILAEAERLGVLAIRRPDDLADDAAPMLGVLRHAMLSAERLCGGLVDVVVCLQPTTPFRTGELIDNVLGWLAHRPDTDSAVTELNGRPTGEVYARRRETLLGGRLLGPMCFDYLRSGAGETPLVNIDTEYDLVRAERYYEAHSKERA